MHETQGQPYPDNAPETAPENPGRSRKIRIRIAVCVALVIAIVASGLVICFSDSLSVFSDSPNLGGCKALIEFMLSDDIQCSDYLTAQSVPVTRSAIEKILDRKRYNYIFPQQLGSNILLETEFSSNEPKTVSDLYVTVEITEQEQESLIDFLDGCYATQGYDLNVYRMVQEELSAYRSGAKTLEEVSRLIQSRVWIYVNE